MKTKAKKSDSVVTAENEPSQVVSNAVIGTFEGECADANITNLNGLDIPFEVWDNLFKSDDYKKAIENRHYIGFLGHPDEVDCQDFQKACIVMREGHIDENGKVYGKFDLIDTPVGRVVKTFIDAGVKFGISVRGAGDIINNSVDPDTFCFRGFDLVAFPAYPNSIPTFTELAASSDIEKQKKYKVLCSAVNSNLDQIDSIEALDIIRSHFAPQSDTYKAVTARRDELSPQCEGADCQEDVNNPDKELDDINAEKVEAMTKLYLEAVEASKKLKAENALLHRALRQAEADSSRRARAAERVVAAQQCDMQKALDKERGRVKLIRASTQKLKAENAELGQKNLTYRQKVQASLKAKDSEIASLRRELNETVIEASQLRTSSSNLDAKVQDLRKQVRASEELLASYQQAYANLFANALGVYAEKLPITASTSIEELQSLIRSHQSSQPVKAGHLLDSAEPVEVTLGRDDVDGSDLVTV